MYVSETKKSIILHVYECFNIFLSLEFSMNASSVTAMNCLALTQKYSFPIWFCSCRFTGKLNMFMYGLDFLLFLGFETDSKTEE